MRTDDVCASLTVLLSELIDGANTPGGAFILNSGDAGLLASLDKLPATDASQSTNGGATIAAHTQHVRYGLSLMNQWAIDGGDPFANARWDEAWTISKVSDAEWAEIRGGLRDESYRWLDVFRTPRDVSEIELSGMIGSVAHVAYHLGAIRQIARATRGPRGGTFVG
jgi:hypothetical protein